MSSAGGGSKPKTGRHVYKTGAAGCGGKGAPTAAKNSGAPLPCPFCDRIFKQDGRLKEHLKNKHADGILDGPQSTEDGSVLPPDSKEAELEAPSSDKGQGHQESSYPVKTPKTLLHEWCQKNKRPAPKFKHVEEAGGFHCRVILPDTKKAEADVILWYKGAPTRTSQEAQHRAAVVGLHHVLGNRRLDRILAEDYRQQWHDLDDAAEKRKAFLKANPPQPRTKPAPLPRELHSVFMSENNRRLVEDLLREQDNGDATSRSHRQTSQVNGSDSGGSVQFGGIVQQVYYHPKENFSGIGMPFGAQAKESWEEHESLDWKQSQPPGKPRTAKGVYDIRRKLLSLGFGANHVNLALAEREDLPSALDWLILNVPEHELPVKFAPDASKASVQVLVRGKLVPSIIPAKPGREASSPLQEYGYPFSDCVAALSEADGDEELALSRLFRSAFGEASPNAIQHTANMAEDRTYMEEARTEEMLALRAIFGDQVFITDSHLALEITVPRHTNTRLEMEVRMSPGSTYPLELPVIAFRSEELPAEVLFDLTRQTVDKAVELLGNPMIHELFHEATELAREAVRNIGESHFVQSVLDHDISNLRIEETSFAENRLDEVVDASASPMTTGSKCNGGTLPLPKTYVPPALRKPSSKPFVEPQEELGLDILVPRPEDPSQLSVKAKTTGPKIDSESESTLLKKEWEQLCKSKRHADMWAVRSKLPAFQHREDLLSVLNSNQVTIVAGQTGCGKSTQVPQYVLEDYIQKGKGSLCNIVCTQPRRLSAIGLADRVSKERGQAVGQTVGYSVRMETNRSSRTRLLFCTIGILLRRLLSDRDLEGVTHVVVDEVHERSLDSDLLLFFLREILKRKVGLRLILMSATVDTDLFVRYFKQDLRLDPSVVTIPGFTFPVQEFYLEDALDFTGYKIGKNSRYAMKKKPGKPDVPNPESGVETTALANDDMDDWESLVNDDIKEDEGVVSMDHYSESTKQALNILDQSLINYDLIELLICVILRGALPSTSFGMSSSIDTKDTVAHPGGTTATGAILVFLPGIAEIRKLQKQLQLSSQIAESYSGTLWVLALHGSLSSDEQKRVFSRATPGSTKVVLATNIAETSVTIDDVVYVIDSGRHKEMKYDHSRGISCLEETWVSKASAKQRRGRAGRVQSGLCIRLFSRQQHKTLEDQQLPEILRVSLDGLCLKVKSLLDEKVEVAASKIITPPEAGALRTSLQNLQDLNALDASEQLTPLGHHLARMPVDARVGKMLLFGCMLKCIDPVVTIAAALSGRSPFVSPSDKREEASAARLRFAGASKSDHYTIVAAYNGWLNARQEGRSAESNYCSANFLSRETLLGIEASRQEFFKILADIGFLRPAETGFSGSNSNSGYDTNANSIRVVKAVICAGFYPNIVRILHPEKTYVHTEGGTVAKVAAARELRFFTKADGRVFIHPASVNFSVGKFESPWLVFSEKMKTSKVFLKDSTMVPSYGLLLFGGKVHVKHEKQAISVDDWLEFEAPARIAVLIKELRSKVEALLFEKIEKPNVDITASPVVSALIRLLTTDGF